MYVQKRKFIIYIAYTQIRYSKIRNSPKATKTTTTVTSACFYYATKRRIEKIGDFRNYVHKSMCDGGVCFNINIIC